MKVQPDLRMDKAVFLARIDTQEERHELAEGRVVKLPRPTLRSRLDRRQWQPFLSFGLDIGPDTFRYPDVLVDRSGGNGQDFAATAPALLIEVLSPEDAEIDLGDKVIEYLPIPSLLAYIVLSQDKPKAWLRSRTSTSMRFGAEVISGAEAVIHVIGLQLELPMADIYAGIEIG
jgi:Uma2 family endonuclease